MPLPELELSSLTDSGLVAETRKGNRDAFDLLISRHYKSCVNIAAFILRNLSDAQDETQAACIKAFEHFDQYLGEAEFASWLFRIVSNQCLMLIRERRRARFVYIDAVPDRERNVPLELQAQTVSTERQLINFDIQGVIRREIGRIPPLLRNVLVMRDVEGLPMPVVAARLKITVPAAKSRLLRARSELRERMTKYCRSGQRCGPDHERKTALSGGRGNATHKNGVTQPAMSKNFKPELSL